MSNHFKYYIILIGLIFVCCAGKKDIDQNKKNKQKDSDQTSTLIEDSSPFYPLHQSIADIQNEIIDLKGQIIEYESRLHNPSINMDLIKMATMPHLKHEITMQNGTLIQGTIIFEDSEKMILKTQIGQLTIEKAYVTDIKETAPMQPLVEFSNKEIEERINDDGSISYLGDVINNGLRRADFVRIIYHFWADDTNPVYSDSCFVTGEDIIYLNGVISDTAINPASPASFELNIELPDSLVFEYITKDIRWNTFE